VTDGQTKLRWLRRAIAVPAVVCKNLLLMVVHDFCHSRDTPPEVSWRYSSCKQAEHSAGDVRCCPHFRETTRRSTQWPQGVVAGEWTEHVSVCRHVTLLRCSHTEVCIMTVNTRRGVMPLAALGGTPTYLEHCTAHLRTANESVETY